MTTKRIVVTLGFLVALLLAFFAGRRFGQAEEAFSAARVDLSISLAADRALRNGNMDDVSRAVRRKLEVDLGVYQRYDGSFAKFFLDPDPEEFRQQLAEYRTSRAPK